MRRKDSSFPGTIRGNDNGRGKSRLATWRPRSPARVAEMSLGQQRPSSSVPIRQTDRAGQCLFEGAPDPKGTVF